MSDKRKAFTNPNSNFGSSYNSLYQNTTFSRQLIVSGDAVPISTVYDRAGWATVAVDSNSAENVFIGNSGVDSSDGFPLNGDGVTSITVSSDDLSDWYVVATGDNVNVYILGAYLS